MAESCRPVLVRPAAQAPSRRRPPGPYSAWLSVCVSRGRSAGMISSSSSSVASSSSYDSSPSSWSLPEAGCFSSSPSSPSAIVAGLENWQPSTAQRRAATRREDGRGAHGAGAREADHRPHLLPRALRRLLSAQPTDVSALEEAARAGAQGPDRRMMAWRVGRALIQLTTQNVIQPSAATPMMISTGASSADVPASSSWTPA